MDITNKFCHDFNLQIDLATKSTKYFIYYLRCFKDRCSNVYLQWVYIPYFIF